MQRFRGSEIDRRPCLRDVEAAERSAHRGQLKIFLGYASGVGKSFRLFDEGRRRHERGEDVVVAAVQADIPRTSRRPYVRSTPSPASRWAGCWSLMSPGCWRAGRRSA